MSYSKDAISGLLAMPTVMLLNMHILPCDAKSKSNLKAAAKSEEAFTQFEYDKTLAMDLIDPTTLAKNELMHELCYIRKWTNFIRL